MKEVNPDATTKMAMKKINQLISSFHRSLSDALIDDELTPTIWYFKELMFLLNDSERIKLGSRLDSISSFVPSCDDNIEDTLCRDKKK